MNENIIISNIEKYKKIKENIIKGGKDNLFIISDFDNTLTKATINNKFIPSMLSILRNEKYLNDGYSEKAFKLFNHYYPIEQNDSISVEEKIKEMETWWKKHFKLLIESGLNKLDILKVVTTKKIFFRQYSRNFIKKLYKNNIPLVILSASGLGYEGILLYLNYFNVLFDNIYIHSNDFIWDKNGYATNYKKPIIHSLNKSFSTIKNKEIIKQSKQRKNLILLGDNESDIKMAEGYYYDNILKIGFLNTHIDEKLEIYKKYYDVVITNDSNMSFVLELINEV